MNQHIKEVADNYRVIHSLPEPYRTILVAMASNNTEEEIAELLGVSSATVRRKKPMAKALLWLKLNLFEVSLTPSTALGQTNVTGTVSLSLPAPHGCFEVLLRIDCSDASASAPVAVCIDAGKHEAKFTVETMAVEKTTNVQIGLRLEARVRRGTHVFSFQSRTITLTLSIEPDPERHR